MRSLAVSIELTDDSTVDECNRSSVTETTVISIVRSYVSKVLENKMLAVCVYAWRVSISVYCSIYLSVNTITRDSECT